MVEGEGTEHKAQQLGMEAKSHNLLLIITTAKGLEILKSSRTWEH